jgi:hypothetical protein
MKISLCFTIILIFTGNCYSIECTFHIPTPGYHYSVFNTLEYLTCTGGYKEVFGKMNGKIVILGSPKPVAEGREDVLYGFVVGRGHLVIEEVNEEGVMFVTNKHLAAVDVIWTLFLLFTIIVFATSILPLITGIPYFLCIILCYLYLSPQFGLTITQFNTLKQNFPNCTTIDDPAQGVEFAYMGLFQFPTKHFIPLNDWVRVKCPLTKFSINQEELKVLKKSLKTTTPETLGILHRAPIDWWDTQEKAISIFWSKMQLEAHNNVFNGMRDVCKNKLCWWGSETKLYKETEHHYVLNSTVLPGHSGLSCRQNHTDTNYYGIVQDYHPNYGINLCTKVTKTEFTYITAYLFAFIPTVFVTIPAIIHRNSRDIKMYFGIVVLFYSILFGLIYTGKLY